MSDGDRPATKADIESLRRSVGRYSMWLTFYILVCTIMVLLSLNH